MYAEVFSAKVAFIAKSDKTELLSTIGALPRKKETEYNIKSPYSKYIQTV